MEIQNHSLEYISIIQLGGWLLWFARVFFFSPFSCLPSEGQLNRIADRPAWPGVNQLTLSLSLLMALFSKLRNRKVNTHANAFVETTSWRRTIEGKIFIKTFQIILYLIVWLSIQWVNNLRKISAVSCLNFVVQLRIQRE